MTLEQFAQLVRRMREMQKKYFSTRSKGSMYESVKLEKQVDKVLENISNPPEPLKREQAEIFK